MTTLNVLNVENTNVPNKIRVFCVKGGPQNYGESGPSLAMWSRETVPTAATAPTVARPQRLQPASPSPHHPREGVRTLSAS